MRPPHPAQRFVAPIGNSSEAPSGTAYIRPTQPIWQLHPPSTIFRVPIGSSSEAPTGTVRVRPAHPI
eukprot:2735783-Pyramimonas_sp.AAC.1